MLVQGDLELKDFKYTTILETISTNIFEKTILINKITSIPYLKNEYIAFKGSSIWRFKEIKNELKLINVYPLSNENGKKIV